MEVSVLVVVLVVEQQDIFWLFDDKGEEDKIHWTRSKIKQSREGINVVI